MTNVGGLRFRYNRLDKVNYFGQVKPRFSYRTDYNYFYDEMILGFDNDYFFNNDFYDNFDNSDEEDEGFYYYKSKKRKIIKRKKAAKGLSKRRKRD